MGVIFNIHTATAAATAATTATTTSVCRGWQGRGWSGLVQGAAWAKACIKCATGWQAHAIIAQEEGAGEG